MSESLASSAVARPLWRNRDFMLLWSGQVVSTVGMRVTALAYPLLVLALAGSPFQAGLVGFAQTLPFLVLYLPAGALVDRWDRRRVMLAADGPGDAARSRRAGARGRQAECGGPVHGRLRGRRVLRALPARGVRRTAAHRPAAPTAHRGRPESGPRTRRRPGRTPAGRRPVRRRPHPAVRGGHAVLRARLPGHALLGPASKTGATSTTGGGGCSPTSPRGWCGCGTSVRCGPWWP
ncbi:MFS transporter [Streptomyces sp. NPDC006700]|uniref:MFS transporter n=1 Tax=Streptomyces sp. NPDC006700 TaxID=3154479 RepID=UPI0033C444E9